VFISLFLREHALFQAGRERGERRGLGISAFVGAPAALLRALPVCGWSCNALATFSLAR